MKRDCCFSQNLDARSLCLLVSSILDDLYDDILKDGSLDWVNEETKKRESEEIKKEIDTARAAVSSLLSRIEKAKKDKNEKKALPEELAAFLEGGFI